MATEPSIARDDIHPFELAGLGTAPYRVIGSAERTFQACPGEPVRAGGMCRYCGQGIRYAAIVRGATGEAFDVGLDCVRKVDFASYKVAREMFRAERAAARAAERTEANRAARAARAAAEAARDAANEAAFRTAAPELAAMLDTLASADGYPGDLSARLMRDIRVSGNVSAESVAHLRSVYAEHTATGHVGTVGKRETFTCTYLGTIAYETSFGVQRIHKFTAARADGTHAMLTWKTGTGYVCKGADNNERPDVGAAVRFKATVKAHGSYRGQAQTELSRLTQVW